MPGIRSAWQISYAQLRNMKRLIKKLIFEIQLALAGEHEKYKVYSRAFGIRFGERVRLTGKPDFGSEPYLIAIGNDVTIANGVTFHTHDGGVGILRSKYPGINVFKPISIGNNVFIGSHSTILPGIVIGNNVIVGASSVVTRSIPDNVVVAGVPAKILRTLQEYEEKVLTEAVYITEKNPMVRSEKIREALDRKAGKSSDKEHPL